MCVCVCEREREREDEKRITKKTLAENARPEAPRMRHSLSHAPLHHNGKFGMHALGGTKGF